VLIMPGSTWTFGRKIAAGFVVAGLVLLAVAFAGYDSTHQLIENEGWVAHTYQVRRQIADLMANLTDLETGQRGFIVTGKQSFLEPYTASLPEVEQHFKTLRQETADNPEQQKRLDALRQLIDTKEAELKSAIDLRNAQGFEAASRFIEAGGGKRSMDQIRAVLDEMDREEGTLLDQRRQAAEQSATKTKTVIFWGTFGGLLFMILVGWFITRSLSQQIGAAITHVQSSSAELQAASNQQVTGAKEQATAMSEITTTISELLATSRQIAESAQRVAHIASENALAARTGDQTVLSTSEAIGGIKRQVDLIVTHMLELGRKSQQIGGILEIINELAEQTNILAINATIEAAGAGDAGRRFSVVADEIRKLADRVGGSTKEIRTLIDEIRAAVNTTVMITEGGTKAVEAGAHQFSNVAAAFKQVGSLVGTTTEAAREIELSTKQQATAVEQVNLAIANVAQAAKETEVSSAQTFQTATQLTSLSRDLMRLIQPQSA
jgi:methyl-accepting chemotaxis protein